MLRVSAVETVTPTCRRPAPLEVGDFLRSWMDNDLRPGQREKDRRRFTTVAWVGRHTVVSATPSSLGGASPAATEVEQAPGRDVRAEGPIEAGAIGPGP